MILVDSSVWITAWKKADDPITSSLSRWIEAGDVLINFLIRTELLQGARDKKHQRTLSELLAPVPVDPFPEQLWNKAPVLYLASRERGVTLTTIDCLIATHAMINSHLLWSLDGIFKKIPEVKLFREIA